MGIVINDDYMDTKERELEEAIKEYNKSKGVSLITDPILWKTRGIHNMDDLHKYLLICDIQEIQNDIYGSCRPVEIFKDMSITDLMDRLKRLKAKLQEIR